MRSAATSFFRDVQFSTSTRDAVAHERHLLDTLAERRVQERPHQRRTSLKNLMTRVGLFR